MVVRRSRLELIFDILRVIRDKGGRIRPTHLMYKSNLSHKLLSGYMEELISKGMIEVVEVEGEKRRMKSYKVVEITEKGLNFLEEFGRMKEFTEAFGLRF